MHIYIKNNAAKFHPNPIEMTEPWAIFEEHCPNKKNNKMSSDIGSVPPDPEI